MQRVHMGERILRMGRAFEKRWNNGDLIGACDVYHDEAIYISATHGIVVGKAQIIARYEESFPDRASMGTLSLRLMESRWDYDDSRASAIWEWKIDKADGTRSQGYALEIYEVHDNKDYIVSDMTLTSRPI